MSNKTHYLYVEDDPHSRAVMQLILNNLMENDNLIIFEDSIDFLSRLRSLEAKPDCIMLDIHIEPHNGFAILDMLKAEYDYKDVKVIALTASVMNEEVEKLRSSGFDGAISKPVSMTTFPGLIKRIVQGENVWHIT